MTTDSNQTSTQSKDEIRILAPWAYYLFAAVFVTMAVLFVTVVGMDPKAPRLPIRCLLGVLMGTVLGCYAVLIGYINQDAGRRGMSRVLVDAACHLCPQRAGHRPLFHLAQTARRSLSAMRCRGRARLRLLPSLPHPPAPRLPTLPAQRRPRRQVLPLLRRSPRAVRRNGGSAAIARRRTDCPVILSAACRRAERFGMRKERARVGHSLPWRRILQSED